MKVFLSWSGSSSRSVALLLRSWIGDVFPDVEPWMSAEDIAAGANWGATLDVELDASGFGILCLTRENLTSKWLMFEAGRLSKSAAIARVVPFLFGLTPVDVAPPLSQFQGVPASETGVLQLAQSLNAMRSSPYTDEKLRRTISKWLPDLISDLAEIPISEVSAARTVRTDREVLEELLASVRELRVAAPTGHGRPQLDVRRVFGLIERIERMTPAELDAAIEVAERAERLAGEDPDRASTGQFFLDVVTHWLSLGKSSHPNRPL